jgi:hypothetical protein
VRTYSQLRRIRLLQPGEDRQDLAGLEPRPSPEGLPLHAVCRVGSRGDRISPQLQSRCGQSVCQTRVQLRLVPIALKERLVQQTRHTERHRRWSVRPWGRRVHARRAKQGRFTGEDNRVSRADARRGCPRRALPFPAGDSLLLRSRNRGLGIQWTYPCFTAAAICGAHIGSMTALLRARDLLLVPALPTLATPSICWLRSAAASDTLAQHRSMQLHGCARHCRQLCHSQSLRGQSSQILRAACAQPAAQSPGDGRTCVSSYGASWARS